MMKGAAVGAGPAPERRPATDSRLPGATPLSAPPRRVGLRTLVRATVLRWRGLGLGTVGAGSAAGSGRGHGRATRDLSRHWWIFVRLIANILFWYALCLLLLVLVRLVLTVVIMPMT